MVPIPADGQSQMDPMLMVVSGGAVKQINFFFLGVVPGTRVGGDGAFPG
jgi:preprotein translocase subunit SecY